MRKNLKAFQIKVNGRVLDYRLGKKLDLGKTKAFFEKRYLIKKLWSGGRHILGILEKGNKVLFLKLATTEGISTVTKNEYRWNEQFNKLVSRSVSNFWVPQNKDCGLYKDKLFYLITDKFDGELLAQRPERIRVSTILQNLLPSVIEFSELIQELGIDQLSDQENSEHQRWFLQKTKSWYGDIPEDIRERYKVMDLLKIVENGIPRLQKRPRHGDFTPWHLIILKGDKLGLFDGEHAMVNGVEYYDIGYFIQRVFSVLQNQD
ncbi:phosphotransferase [Candidatus Daviesbacteria bacterium]|nr:phosphotransferase [Candidatus Daviesbacteria bacterium]